VALAEDRDRRADGPAEGNRCYAERAPRRRDLVYQADYCYSPRFASCSVFLAWAARNAAEPAYVTDAARKAWSSGISMPEDGVARPPGLDAGTSHMEVAATAAGSLEEPGLALPSPTPEGGLFGPADPTEVARQPAADELDWVPASAWAEAPWDPEAEAEADELEALVAEASEDEEPEELEVEATAPAEEDLVGPRVPAALPMRRRRSPQEPIKARGSGEWWYADPTEREPLVRRRSGVGAPIMLAVLGLLVVAIVVFLLPTLLGGGREQTAGFASPSPGTSPRPVVTRAPVGTAEPTASPSPVPEPQIRSYTVKPGDTLFGIAGKLDVNMRLLQCLNALTNPNLLQPGQKLLVPPDGYSCPPGWRRASPEPDASPAPEPSPGADVSPGADGGPEPGATAAL
jgi:LysM repeat protein